MTTRVYVGNVSDRTDERDLDDIFYKYGRIRDIFVKRPDRGSCFAFVEFDDPRDAKDAIYELDGVKCRGNRLRVEASRSRRNDAGGGRGGNSRINKSKYRLRILGLPRDTSWQDLKDFIRPATNNITFADVSGETGYVEVAGHSDIEAVMAKLDDTELKNRYNSRARVRIEIESDGKGSRSSSPRGSGRGSRGGRGRSRSRSRSRSRDRGRGRSRSRSRSRSRNRSRSRSRSKSRSRSGDRADARGRSRSKSKEKEKGKSRSRSRSRSPGAKKASRSRSRSRSGSRGKPAASGSKSRSRSKSEDRSKKEASAEKN